MLNDDIFWFLAWNWDRDFRERSIGIPIWRKFGIHFQKRLTSSYLGPQTWYQSHWRVYFACFSSRNPMAPIPTWSNERIGQKAQIHATMPILGWPTWVFSTACFACNIKKVHIHSCPKIASILTMLKIESFKRQTALVTRSILGGAKRSSILQNAKVFWRMIFDGSRSHPDPPEGSNCINFRRWFQIWLPFSCNDDGSKDIALFNIFHFKNVIFHK